LLGLQAWATDAWLCSIIRSLVLQYFQCYSFLLRIMFAIWGSFMLPYEFEDWFFYFCEEWHWNFDGHCIESVDWFQ
jgi:hypothetical protein